MSNHVFSGLPKYRAPRTDGPMSLCYGACPKCGWWCACPEGWVWPSCPTCGLEAVELMPQRGESFDPAEYVDFPGGEPKAFIARFMTEAEALEEILGKPVWTPAPPTKVDRAKGLLRGLVGAK